MARFVMVAGACHGAWCWERVVPLLEARGHRVETAELPGMGADRTPLAGLDMIAWARAVAQAIDADPEPAIPQQRTPEEPTNAVLPPPQFVTPPPGYPGAPRCSRRRCCRSTGRPRG